MSLYLSVKQSYKLRPSVTIKHLSFNAVAINLIVQHIQDILNGGLTKRMNGWFSGYGTEKKQPNIESSSRPH